MPSSFLPPWMVDAWQGMLPAQTGGGEMADGITRPQLQTSWQKIPHRGQCASGCPKKVAMPEIPVKPSLKMRLVPYRGEDTSRCRTELIKKPVVVKKFGTLRCMSATHLRGPGLSKRNFHELPQCIGFQPAWRKRMAQVKRKIKDYRVVNPLFGEWLYGLPRGWTDCRAKVKASTQHGGGMLKSFDTFTGIGGLALSAEDFFKPIA